MKRSNVWAVVLGLACVGCCAFPFFLVGGAGAFGLSFFTGRLELIALGGAISVAAILYYVLKKPKHSNTCPMDCECGKQGRKKTC